METCKVVASSFFSTGAHYVGFILTAIVLAITLGLFLKTLLSYIKTKRKLGALLQKQIFSLPQKLKIILERNGVKEDLIIVVEEGEDYALTIDWFSPKIVVSTKLISKLNKYPLEAVILHEYYHLKYRHPLLLIVGEILSSSLLLLPVLGDLTRQMRTVLEKEADLFVSNQQKTTRYLNLALNKVDSTNRFNLYPTFSHPVDDGPLAQKRNDYYIKKSSITISLLVILIGLFLFKFPQDVHTIQAQESIGTANCGENVCSTHCPLEDVKYESSIHPAFQAILISSQDN